METTTIRPLAEADIAAASALARRVFDQFVGPDYSAEGIATFHRFIDPSALSARLRSGETHIWGAFRNGQLAGVLATRGATHISLLFVDAASLRQGIARALFDHLRDACLSLPASRRITVNSSPYAVGIYARLGFRQTEAERTQDGIRFTPMEYLIN